LVDASEAGDPETEFPAFSSVQLQARKVASGTCIDVLGVFRKQDLALWWPVNMAELREIQEKALAAAGNNASLAQPVLAGRLIAVATTGVHERVLPQMAGTTLDRAIDLAPTSFHVLAYLAAQPRQETQEAWERALADVGTIENDILMVPTLGVARLKEAVELQRDLGEAPKAITELLRSITKLARHSEQAVRELSKDGDDGRSPEFWSEELGTDVRNVLAAVRSSMRAANIQWRRRP
jgi:hypothetical protein